jgi:hypothetical protein
MKSKLLIVTDLGLLKAYHLQFREEGSPKLSLLDQTVFEPAHQHVTDQVTDSAGRRAAPTQGGGSIADSHNLKLEVERRLVKQLAQKIEALAMPAPSEGFWLAAPKDLLRPITEALPQTVRARVEKQLALDLTKLEPKEVLSRFLAP